MAELERLKGLLGSRARCLSLSLEARAEVLAEACARWLAPGDHFRRAGVRVLVREGGYSPAGAAAALDATFAPWGRHAWRALARREGAWAAAAVARQPFDHLAGALPDPALVVPHVLGSGLPAPNLLPVFFTLLAGRAAVARAGRRLPSFPAVALGSVAALHPELGALGAVRRWPRSRADLTEALFRGSPLGTATGGDEAVEAVRARLGPETRLVAHPHRVSFACVSAEAVADPRAAARTARRLARDVALHDQQGCLSPIGVLVEGRGPAGLRRLGGALARALEERERAWPRGRLEAGAAAAVRAFHDAFALGAAGAAPERVLAPPELRWVVGLLRRGESPPPPAYFRCVWLLPARDFEEMARVLGAWRGRTAALGFRGTAAGRAGARRLARSLGASRLCPLGRMQSPPLAWPQDGVPALRVLMAPVPARARRPPGRLARPAGARGERSRRTGAWRR